MSMAYPKVTWDKSANAAAITFGQTEGGRTSLLVKDKDDNLVAIVDFASSGELVQLELLIADVQLPQNLRH